MNDVSKEQYWRERAEHLESSFDTIYRELLATRTVLTKIADEYKLDKKIVEERILEEEHNITL